LGIVEELRLPIPKGSKSKSESDSLHGWAQIAAFLGQAVSVAQRWAESGMPVQKRGRNVYSSREELNRWLGRESAGEPVQIATEGADLAAELKRGLSYVRKHSTARKRR
jgi:phage terminase Nu1 subunit (DNA packaging protein)